MQGLLPGKVLEKFHRLVELFNVICQITRLLELTCNGIRERIQLLGELITSKKLDSVPEVYDEMAHIIVTTKRNERFMAGTDGQRLLELTTAAKSNANIDLYNLDLELQRQFGLYSVEVTGDGVRDYLLLVFTLIIYLIVMCLSSYFDLRLIIRKN